MVASVIASVLGCAVHLGIQQLTLSLGSNMTASSTVVFPNRQAQNHKGAIHIIMGVYAKAHLADIVLLGISAAGLVCWCDATSSAASADSPQLCTFLLFCRWSASTLLSRADRRLKLPRPAVMSPLLCSGCYVLEDCAASWQTAQTKTSVHVMA